MQEIFSKLQLNFSFGGFLTQNYCMSSLDFEYIAFMLLFFYFFFFLRISAVLDHFYHIEQSSQDILQKRTQKECHTCLKVFSFLKELFLYKEPFRTSAVNHLINTLAY